MFSSGPDGTQEKVALLEAVVHPARTMMVAAASGAKQNFQVLNLFPPSI